MKLVSAIIFILVLLESASQLYVRILNKDLKTKLYQSKATKTDVDQPYRFSPYFGFVTAAGNNFGFNSKFDYPFPKKKDSYVVAILGGSVAGHFAMYIYNTADYETQFKKFLPQLKDKKIHFMNLAIPGYKQPQQFYILSYFLDNIDMVIQIDGWNEVYASSDVEVPPDFPMYIESLGNRTSTKNYTEARWYKALIDKLETTPILNQSMTVFIYKNALENKLAEATMTSISKGKAFYPDMSFEERRRSMVKTWSRFINMERTLLKANCKKGFFFVQPNQYNPGTKIFTDEEKLLAYHPERIPTAIETFQLIREEAKKENVVDLANIYKNEKSTIYIDDCCHVNGKGNEIMSDAILRNISQTFSFTEKKN